MATIDLTQLLLPYGNRTLKVKATGTGFDDSDWSNTVTYACLPVLTRIDGSTLRVSNLRAACSTYTIYDATDDSVLETVSFSGSDGDHVDLDVTNYGFTANAYNPVYCVASDGNDTFTSATLKFWYGSSIILGVSGLYNSTTALTRTDAAVGLTWTMTSNEITSDFDNLFPYNLMVKETVDGNAMVYVPEMYWRLGYDSNGYLTDIAVAPTEMECGSGQVSAHSDAFYYGAYGASYDGSNKMQSKSGVARRYSQTRAQFRTAAQANGTGYQIIDVLHTRILEMLWLIEFADKNSENIMWGLTSYNGQCGATDTITAPSGQLANQGRMRWRYIEDFIGNGYEFFDGIVGQYVTADPTEYGDTANVGTKMSGTNINQGYELAALGSPDPDNPLLLTPKYCISNSSYNTYFCDYAYVVDGTYVAYRGRNGSASNNGLSYWGVSGGVSSSAGSIGSRLLKLL